MIGTVWGSTTARANVQLQKIIGEYNWENVKPIKEKISLNSSFVEFENGDRWKAVPAHEHWRGIKCNISYIDVEIPKDFIDTIIKHSTCVHPYQAFHYYGYWSKGDNIDEETFI